MDTNMNVNNNQKQLAILKLAIEVGDEIQVHEILKAKIQLTRKTSSEIVWLAVLRGQIKIAMMLITSGAEFKTTNPFDKSGCSLLHKLVEIKDPRCHRLAIFLMKHGANVNSLDNSFLTPLDYAVRSKSPTKLIKELINHGARVFHWDILRHAASYPNASEITELLIGNTLVTRSQNVVDALFDCAMEAYVKEEFLLPTVKLLLNVKENISIIDVLRHGCILIRAIRMEKVKMVELFIEYGFDVNKPAEPGTETPLFVASMSQRTAITKLLIQAGAKINAISPKTSAYGIKYIGYPIHGACKYSSYENIQTFLRYGADINVIDSQGCTPLSIVLMDQTKLGIQRLILKYVCLLIKKGKVTNEYDLKRIKSRGRAMSSCCKFQNELDKMMVMTIHNHVTFFSIFVKKLSEIAFLTRNSTFIRNYNVTPRISHFPSYYEEMDFIFDKAVICKNLLSDKERAISDSLENIMPFVALEKIIYHFYSNEIKLNYD